MKQVIPIREGIRIKYRAIVRKKPARKPNLVVVDFSIKGTKFASETKFTSYAQFKEQKYDEVEFVKFK